MQTCNQETLSRLASLALPATGCTFCLKNQKVAQAVHAQMNRLLVQRRQALRQRPVQRHLVSKQVRRQHITAQRECQCETLTVSS